MYHEIVVSEHSTGNTFAAVLYVLNSSSDSLQRIRRVLLLIFDGLL